MKSRYGTVPSCFLSQWLTCTPPPARMSSMRGGAVEKQHSFAQKRADAAHTCTVGTPSLRRERTRSASTPHAAPPPPPLVLSGHAASLTPY